MFYPRAIETMPFILSYIVLGSSATIPGKMLRAIEGDMSIDIKLGKDAVSHRILNTIQYI